MSTILLDDSIKSNLLKSKIGKQKLTSDVNILDLNGGFDYIAINCGYALRLSKEKIEKVYDDEWGYGDEIPFNIVFLHGTDFKHYYEHHVFVMRIIEYEDGAKELHEKLTGSTKVEFNTLFKKNIDAYTGWMRDLKNSDRYKKASDAEKRKILRRYTCLSWSDFTTIAETLYRCQHCGCFGWGTMYGLKIITIDGMRILSVEYDTESG